MFGYAALLAAAFAPGLFWLWYFYRKDTLEPEPKRLILRMFFLGILLGIPATILELFPVDSIVMTVILAPANRRKSQIPRRSLHRLPAPRIR